MLYLAARLALLSAVSFSILIGAMDSLLPDDYTARDWFFTTEPCALPCWGGIDPGFTRLREMTRILDENRWARSIDFNYSMDPETGILIWQWDNSVSDVIDRRRQGTAWAQHNLIRWIDLPMRMSYGEVWLALGVPAQGANVAVPALSVIDHYVLYAQTGVQLRVRLPCPVTPDRLWNAQVNLLIGAQWVANYKPYQTPVLAPCH